MPKKRKIILSVITLLIIVCACYFFNFARYAGYYSSVKANSAYQLHLSPLGHIEIVDIGAGNPALEGTLYGIPFSEKYTVKAKGETDESFLNISENNMKAELEFSHTDIGDIKKNVNLLVISTKDETMEFRLNIDTLEK